MQSGNQALRFEYEWAQGEEHLANFLCGSASQLFDFKQFLGRLIGIALYKPPGKIHPHGNCSDGLRRPIMKITRKLVPGFFLDLGNALLFLLQIAI